MDGELPQSDVTGAVLVNLRFLNRGLYSLPRRVTRVTLLYFAACFVSVFDVLTKERFKNAVSLSVRQGSPAVKCLFSTLEVPG
jgi:hypothetical protein